MHIHELGADRILSLPQTDHVEALGRHPHLGEVAPECINEGEAVEPQGEDHGGEEEEAVTDAGSVSENSDDSRFTMTYKVPEARM